MAVNSTKSAAELIKRLEELDRGIGGLNHSRNGEFFQAAEKTFHAIRAEIQDIMKTGALGREEENTLRDSYVTTLGHLNDAREEAPLASLELPFPIVAISGAVRSNVQGVVNRQGQN